MTQKEITVLEAALGVLARYGMRRTTMCDIAKASDISRQTLYSLYPSKDDVVTAAVGYFCAKTSKAVQETWQNQTELSDKVETFYDLEVRAIFDLIHASPDAEDLVSGASEKTRAAIKCAYAEKQAVLVTLFTPYSVQIEATGQTVQDFAAFVQSSAMNFKHTAETKDELNRLLASLKSAIALTTQG